MSNEEMIKRRIACPDGGYPASEAQFPSILAYVEYLEVELDNERHDHFSADRG